MYPIEHGESIEVQTRTREMSDQVDEMLEILHDIAGQHERHGESDTDNVNDNQYGEYKDMFTELETHVVSGL